MNKGLRKAAFDIENALSMYALSFCTIPAESIYDKQALAGRCIDFWDIDPETMRHASTPQDLLDFWSQGTG